MNYKRIRAGTLALAAVLVLAACGTAPRRNAETRVPVLPAGQVTAQPIPQSTGQSTVIFVIKRSWHTDIGFDVADLHPPLATLQAELPGSKYLLFGFGDKHYLLGRGSSFMGMVGAVWPGEGLVLMTGLENSPEEAFGADGVARITVDAGQARKLEDFVWSTLATTDGVPHSLAPGPYGGSSYYASAMRYSGVHTCNTWTAEALRTAGLPVHSFGVEFSGQVWRQVRHLQAYRAPHLDVSD